MGGETQKEHEEALNKVVEEQARKFNIKFNLKKIAIKGVTIL